MRTDVFFGTSTLTAADTAGRTAVVIDVLRASTSIAAALCNGARTIIPLDGADEVIIRAKAYERREVLLAGERRMLPVPGFDVGNSPHEYTREMVEGRTVLLSTTNGTAALVAVQGARETIVTSYANFSVSVNYLVSALQRGSDVTIVCAGRERQFSLEDTACAGRLVRYLIGAIPELELNDAARAAMLIESAYGDDLRRIFSESAHGQALADAGFESDLEICAATDAFPVVPVYSDHRIVALSQAAE
ncbi:MAG TPA: 2-phosphosulfolactate phosphatase [Gemmatimonadales bacterium]|nr:2-phosphosulfolactate phosphatase [Gemmatimonadales bacterium]